MKERIYKLFLTIMVCLSLGSGPIAQNEIVKMLEALSGTKDAKVQELDEDEESEEIRKKKKFLKHLQCGSSDTRNTEKGQKQNGFQNGIFY